MGIRAANDRCGPGRSQLFASSGNRSGENEVRLGIEVNKWGRPVAYWVNPGHPSDFGGSLLREPIPADQIVHLFDPYRVNQTRGLTWFHAGMMSLKMLNGYMEAEIVAARVGAAKMAFLVNTDPACFRWAER
jgi:capsid protein